MDAHQAADRIRKLRAKADSTTFPAEAEALRAKADQLAQMFGVAEPDAQRDEAWRDLFERTRVNMQQAQARVTTNLVFMQANGMTVRVTSNVFVHNAAGHDETGGIHVTGTW